MATGVDGGQASFPAAAPGNVKLPLPLIAALRLTLYVTVPIAELKKKKVMFNMATDIVLS